jgi:hypothetical protein
MNCVPRQIELMMLFERTWTPGDRAENSWVGLTKQFRYSRGFGEAVDFPGIGERRC